MLQLCVHFSLHFIVVKHFFVLAPVGNFGNVVKNFFVLASLGILSFVLFLCVHSLHVIYLSFVFLFSHLSSVLLVLLFALCTVWSFIYHVKSFPFNLSCVLFVSFTLCPYICIFFPCYLFCVSLSFHLPYVPFILLFARCVSCLLFSPCVFLVLLFVLFVIFLVFTLYVLGPFICTMCPLLAFNLCSLPFSLYLHYMFFVLLFVLCVLFLAFTLFICTVCQRTEHSS